jgi:hypothetical protein
MRRSSKLLFFCALIVLSAGLLVAMVPRVLAAAWTSAWDTTTWPTMPTGWTMSYVEGGTFDNSGSPDSQWFWAGWVPNFIVVRGPAVETGDVMSVTYNIANRTSGGQVGVCDSDSTMLEAISALGSGGWATGEFVAPRAGYFCIVASYGAGAMFVGTVIVTSAATPTPTATATSTPTPTPTATPRAYTHDYGVYPPPVCSNLVTYGPGTDSLEYWTYYPFSAYYVEYRSLTGGAPGVLVERWRVDSPDMVHSYVYGPFPDGVTVVIEPESGSCGAWSRVEMMAVIHGETAITATVPLVRLEKLPWSAKWGNTFDHHGVTSGSYAFGAYTAGGLYDAWVSWDITDTQRHDILFTCWGAIEWGSTTGQSQSYTCDGIPKNFDAGADISEFSASGQMGWIGQLQDYAYNPNDPTPTRFPQPTGTATPTACAGCTATPTPWLPASDPRGTATPTPWRTPGAPSVSTPVPVGTARSWIAAPGAYPTPGGNEYQAITDVVEFVTEVNCIDWVIPLTNNLPNGEFFANIPQGYTMCATTIQSLRLFQIDFMPMIIACGSLLVLGTAVNFLRDR